ncbi:MAG: hypothetical protein AAGG51_26930 [Cyanobacteria bacterium P01_G01_bin.54]
MSNYNPNLTLNQALQQMGGDPPSSIHWMVRLLENPASPIALPGNVDLHRHDYLHLLLDRGLSLDDEAFVIGFTMGNDPATKPWHLASFKLVSWLLYPREYRFSWMQLKIFDLGLVYGRSLTTKNFNRLDFSPYFNQTLAQLRSHFGIDSQTLASFEQVEQILKGQSGSEPIQTSQECLAGS